MSTNLVLHRIVDVIAKTGLSRATIYRLVATGNFPKPCKLGARSSAWSSVEVDNWMVSKLDKRASDLQSTVRENQSSSSS